MFLSATRDARPSYGELDDFPTNMLAEVGA
jgi:hypothetical protein